MFMVRMKQQTIDNNNANNSNNNKKNIPVAVALSEHMFTFHCTGIVKTAVNNIAISPYNL